MVRASRFRPGRQVVTLASSLEPGCRTPSSKKSSRCSRRSTRPSPAPGPWCRPRRSRWSASSSTCAPSCARARRRRIAPPCCSSGIASRRCCSSCARRAARRRSSWRRPTSPTCGCARASCEHDILLGKAPRMLSGAPIVDWRNAPISKIFYRYRQGEEYEEEIAGRQRSGEVAARRVVTIRDRTLQRVEAPEGVFRADADAADGWKPEPPRAAAARRRRRRRAARARRRARRARPPAHRRPRAPRSAPTSTSPTSPASSTPTSSS